MRKVLVGVAAAIAVVGMSGGTALATPEKPSKAEEWDCGGEETTIFTAGRNGWVDGVQYHAVSFSIEGTFTPTGGEPEPFSESKTWAGGKSGPGEITCTQHFQETDAEGTVVADGEVTAFPVR